jgi:hypothetical protein
MLRKNKWKAIAQTVALSFMLVILPLISWYYLNRGLDYQIEARSELKDLGKWSFINSVDIFGNNIDTAEISKKMIIGALYDAQNFDTFKKLYEQFDERDDLLFFIFCNDSTESSYINEFLLEYGNNDVEQIKFFKLNDFIVGDQFLSSSKNYFLADIQGIVRKFNDVGDVQQVKRLIEHTAILLPKKKDRELVFKRELEK